MVTVFNIESTSSLWQTKWTVRVTVYVTNRVLYTSSFLSLFYPYFLLLLTYCTLVVTRAKFLCARQTRMYSVRVLKVTFSPVSWSMNRKKMGGKMKTLSFSDFDTESLKNRSTEWSKTVTLHHYPLIVEVRRHRRYLRRSHPSFAERTQGGVVGPLRMTPSVLSRHLYSVL